MTTYLKCEEYHRKYGTSRANSKSGSASNFSNSTLEDLIKVISNVNGKKFRTKKSASHTVSTASSEECIIGDIKYTLANVCLFMKTLITPQTTKEGWTPVKRRRRRSRVSDSNDEIRLPEGASIDLRIV